MKTGICLTVKNEAPYLAEWIVYHVGLGFHQIWIYDNNSQDRIEEALRPYLGNVERIHWPQVPAFPDNIQDCLLRAKILGIEWLAHIDADEFIVPVNGDQNGLSDVLTKATDKGIDEISIPIYFYSSDSHIVMPEGRVVDNYRTDVKISATKAIVRVDSNPRPHTTHDFKSKRCGKTSDLRINHYHNKSKEDALIRHCKGFVDHWGWKHLSQEGAIREVWLRLESCSKGFPTKNYEASRLSDRFNTPGAQNQLAVDPIKVFIIEFNQYKGSKLKKQLSPVFRDIVLLDIADIQDFDINVYLPKGRIPAPIKRVAKRASPLACEFAGNPEILWFIPADVCLNDTPVSYKKAIITAYPFGTWRPSINRECIEKYIHTDRGSSVTAPVQNVAWAVSRESRGLGVVLLEEFALGREIDLFLSSRFVNSSLRNVMDSTVSLSHVQRMESKHLKSAKVLVIICSSRSHRERRDRIRKTWLGARPDGIQCIFVVGSGEGDLEDDVFELNIDDGSPSVCEKVHKCLGHAIEHFDFDYLFKCSDDTYVALDRLKSLADNEFALTRDGRLRHSYSCGDDGYLFSLRTARLLANSPKPRERKEKIWVRRTAKALDFKVLSACKLKSQRRLYPKPGNDIIVTPCCTPDIMSAIHYLAKVTDDSRDIQSFHAKHRHWEGAIDLLPDGIFLGGNSKPHGRWTLRNNEMLLLLHWFHWPADRMQKTDWGYTSMRLCLIRDATALKGLNGPNVKSPDSSLLKIHFGCGLNRIDGWRNVDKDMDLRKPLPLPDSSVRLAFAEHVIEHLTPMEAWRFFKEVRRVLIPGGGLRFVIPCVELIYQRFDEDYRKFIELKTAEEGSLEGAVQSIICNWGHQTIWTVESMKVVLSALGFEVWGSSIGISRFAEAIGIDGHGKQIGMHANWVESGVVEAVKATAL